MISNPLIRRILGESADLEALDRDPEIKQLAGVTDPETDTAPVEAPVEAPAEDELSDIDTASIDALVKQWQGGDHMAVATRLMFSSASYRDFVRLIFKIGEEDGLILGSLLDEIADTEEIPPPATPEKYRNLLHQVDTSARAEDVI